MSESVDRENTVDMHANPITKENFQDDFNATMH